MAVRALVYTEPQRVTIDHVPDPEPARGEVLIEVRAAGICASDVEGVASGSPPRVPPLVLGHEVVGIRSDTSERVVVNPVVSCWKCDRCAAGQDNLCRRRRIVGVHRAGGFAERVAVPEGNCQPLPDTVDWPTATLIEPLANAVHAVAVVQRLEPSVKRLAIIGAGALGICTILAAGRRGIASTVFDRVSSRLAIASEAGAALTAGEVRGEFDVVVDAVGSAATRKASVEHLRPGGTAVWIGLRERDPGFDALALVRGEQRVAGVCTYLRDEFRSAVDLLPSVRASWVSTSPLDEGAAVFDRLLRGEITTALRTVLVP